MNAGSIFLMRMGLGILFAYIIAKVFYPSGGLLTVAAFAVFFVGLAYLLAHMRSRRERQERMRR
jgi:hypothetical protein